MINVKEKTLIIIEKVQLPEDVHAACGTDGKRYFIVINETDTPERQEEALMHEITHIWRGDFERTDISADSLEQIRHSEPT